MFREHFVTIDDPEEHVFDQQKAQQLLAIEAFDKATAEYQEMEMRKEPLRWYHFHCHLARGTLESKTAADDGAKTPQLFSLLRGHFRLPRCTHLNVHQIAARYNPHAHYPLDLTPWRHFLQQIPLSTNSTRALADRISWKTGIHQRIPGNIGIELLCMFEARETWYDSSSRTVPSR